MEEAAKRPLDAHARTKRAVPADIDDQRIAAPLAPMFVEDA
jgi:hypothetical protein